MGGIRPPTKQRRIAVTLASCAVAGAALWFVLQRFEWDAFATRVSNLDPLWIAAAVAADILSYVFLGARWSYLLRPVANSSVLSTTRAVYAGLFVNEILPMRPGEALRGMIVARRAGKPLARVMPSMVAERVMDAVVLIVAGLLASSYVRLPASISEFMLVIGALLVAGTTLLLVRERIPAAWLEPLGNPAALALSIGVLLAQCVAVWCILRACGLSWTPAAGFSITVILRIGTTLPLAPANIGTHQLAMLLGLAVFGLTGQQATAVAFIAFALLTLPLLLLGAVALVTSQVSVRDATSRRAPVPVGPAPGSWTHWKSYPTDNFWWHRP